MSNLDSKRISLARLEKMFVLDDNSSVDKLKDFKKGLGWDAFIKWEYVQEYLDKESDSVEFGATIYYSACVKSPFSSHKLKL